MAPRQGRSNVRADPPVLRAEGKGVSQVGDVYRKGHVEIRCGDYRDVLDGVTPDCVVTDPPYGKRTHSGHDAGTAAVNRVRSEDERRLRVDKRNGAVYAVGKNRRRPIDYAHWTEDDIAAFVARWASVPGWIVPLTSQDLWEVWQEAYEALGRYSFAPIPCCIRGMTVRLCGDGPSSWSVRAVPSDAMPSRPRSMPPWGTLDGFYSGPSERQLVAGGKPLWLMRALVRDYSRPGNLICDPCAGGGTTLIAAALEGRRAIGAELDPVTFEKACTRIENIALTIPLGLEIDEVKMTQEGLFGSGE